MWKSFVLEPYGEWSEFADESGAHEVKSICSIFQNREFGACLLLVKQLIHRLYKRVAADRQVY
jgi:hypothetical protein